MKATTTMIIPRNFPEHGTQKGISYLSSEDHKWKKYFLLSARRFNYRHFKFLKRLGHSTVGIIFRALVVQERNASPPTLSAARVECQAAPLTGHG